MIEKWAYFFKHADETNEKDLSKIAGDDLVIEEAYEVLNRFSLSEAEMRTYEAEEKRVRDNQAVLKQQMYDLEAAKSKGLAEGKAEGKAEERVTMARKMLASGINIELIVQCTGLSEAEIKSLRFYVE
jgi:predicted transposase/invertase (TIGR01784 family)